MGSGSAGSVVRSLSQLSVVRATVGAKVIEADPQIMQSIAKDAGDMMPMIVRAVQALLVDPDHLYPASLARAAARAISKDNVNPELPNVELAAALLLQGPDGAAEQCEQVLEEWNIFQEWLWQPRSAQQWLQAMCDSLRPV